MSKTEVTGAQGAEEECQVPAAAADGEMAARVRYEREAAALDLADAEQARCQSAAKAARAAELYASSESHRRLAGRLEAGDTSALLGVEAKGPVCSDG